MKRDLKLDLRDLYGLHSASLEVEHGIKLIDADGASPWRAFSPTSFVYAFFTFNSIYTWDWAKSLAAGETLEWDPVLIPEKKPGGGGRPRLRDKTQTEQFAGLLDFYYDKLAADTPGLVAASLNKMLTHFRVLDPAAKLADITITNEDRITEQAKGKFTLAFQTIRQPTTEQNEHRNALYDVLHFIYLVRCNIFHGSKTAIHMQGTKQQERLLIYAAVLIATNGLLFEVAGQANIYWETPRPVWSEREETVSAGV